MATFFCDEEIEKLENGRTLAILRIRGYIQFEAVGEMEKQIQDCYDKDIQCLALDMGSVHSITSSGLGTLMKMHDQFETSGRHLVFLFLPKKIYTLFETLGIASYFLKFESKTQLIEFFARGILPEDKETNLPQKKEMQVMYGQEESKRPFNKKETLFDINIAQDIQNEALLNKGKKTPEPVLALPKEEKESIHEEAQEKEEKASSRTQNTNIKRSPADTKRSCLQSFSCKILIKYYRQMQAGKTYPIKISLAWPQEKNTTETPPLEKSLEIFIVSLFPGCIISPPFRKIYAGSKFSSAVFEGTPIVTGKHIAKIELSDSSGMPQIIKLPTLIFSKWWERISLFLAILIFVIGFISQSYQMAPCPDYWNFTYLLYQTGGLFYPCLSISLIFILVFGFFKKYGKEKQESLMTEMVFRQL